MERVCACVHVCTGWKHKTKERDPTLHPLPVASQAEAFKRGIRCCKRKE